MNLLPFLLAVFLTTSSVACGGAPFTTLDPSTSTPSDDGGPTPTTDAPLGAPPSPASDAPFDADRAPPPDAALPLACLPSLTAVGQGDFRVAFDLQITHSTSTVAILSQRLDCAASSSSWTVTMTPAGGLVATVSDGQGHVVSVEEGDSIDDGKVHRMAVVRGMGALMIENDGSVVSAKVVDEDGLLFGGAVDVGTVTCPALAESAGVVALEGHGTVSGVCLTTGAP